MITVFKYKQKILQKVLILIFMLIIPFLFNTMSDYKSLKYYIILVTLEMFSFLYQASKSLIVSESGIELRLLWFISWENVSWGEMEEAYVITGGAKSNQSSLQQMSDPYAVTGWLDGVFTGTTIKIIITNREALYIKLQDIRKSDDLYIKLQEKVRFVKK